MLRLFIKLMYYSIDYEAGHSLDNRTLMVKYHMRSAMFKQLFYYIGSTFCY